ncbi:4-amino-4-deoxy-L-arabinose transferase-like glycosyltransferase [Fusobacterium sp. PH5-7]|uniref:ArnT family glycosyltransferase n=1 Tax=Fusobacterium sp. PH5-7 TaxID=2940528 RepID=UPI0024746758|nr:glycosyltransferase family 39 protein [Fusobacterium sp. PH5-7]MDH6457361.1 4-amino-4-deoxy-L-arabinose transferase-like glycosyltransferase [Fusobacterium sp. PH5-7]
MEKKSHKKQYIFIILIYLIIFVPLVFLRYPDARNELKYFVITEDMIKAKNYLILKYFSELYPDKPPLYFWILIFFKTYFSNMFFSLSLLFGSLLPSFGISILSFKLFTKLKDEKFGFFITLILMTIPYFTGISVFLRMDMLMSFFISLALYLFFTTYINKNKPRIIKLIVMYTSIGIAVLTKGGAGFIIPILVILTFLVLERNLSFLKEIHFFRGILLILAILGIWFYEIYIQPDGKEYISLLLGQETLGRMVKAKTHSRPLYFYPVRLPLILYPYGIIYLGAFIYYLKNIRKYFSWSLIEKIGFAWSVVPLIFFSFVSGKLEIYLLPLYTGFVVLGFTFMERIKYSKIGNIFIKITEVLLIIPLLLDILFNKEKNREKCIKYLIGTTLVLYLTFPFLLTKYNDEFTLKNIVQLIQNTNNEIITYKFSDFLNISYEVNKNIEDIENKDVISNIPKDRKTFIVSREKYKDEVEENNKFKLLYNNRAYYLYSN